MLVTLLYNNFDRIAERLPTGCLPAGRSVSWHTLVLRPRDRYMTTTHTFNMGQNNLICCKLSQTPERVSHSILHLVIVRQLVLQQGVTLDHYPTITHNQFQLNVRT